jgi:uncharacterized RDD family membrane protein YckC
MSAQINHEINESTKFAGFWIRVWAYILDYLVILFLLVLIGLIVHLIFPGTDPESVEVLEAILVLSVMWIYFTGLPASSWQATVGKKVAGIKIVDKNGNRISFARATGRFLATFLSVLIFSIGYLMVGLTRRKQGLHDMLAGTYVIWADHAS